MLVWGQTTWKVSAAALVAGQALDTASSWGKLEANPILGGTFGYRAVAIKGGMTGGLLALEYRAIHKHPRAWRIAIIANYVCAGILIGVAAKNWNSGLPPAQL